MSQKYSTHINLTLFMKGHPATAIDGMRPHDRMWTIAQVQAGGDDAHPRPTSQQAELPINLAHGKRAIQLRQTMLVNRTGLNRWGMETINNEP
jgi:hypothetical protein